MQINAKEAYVVAMKRGPYNVAKREILQAAERGEVSITLGSLPRDVRKHLQQEGYKLESHGYHSCEISWDRTYWRRFVNYVRRRS